MFNSMDAKYYATIYLVQAENVIMLLKTQN